MPCRSYAGVTICGPGATEEIHRETLNVRWCFICRKRRTFEYVVTAPVGISYYGPSPSIQCSEGHHNGDVGFGREREWDG